jgi:hypothetical protein
MVVMISRRLLLAGLFVFFCTLDGNAAGPQPPLVKVGNWQGGAYTNDTTGAFSHCVAGATYDSGIYFAVSVNRNHQWSLGFAHQSWQINPGQVIPIDLTFDNRSQFHVYAKALLPKFVFVEMPNDSRLIREFRQATMMTAFASGNLFQFKLDTTSRLLPALVDCVNQGLGGGPTHSPIAKTQLPISKRQPSTGSNAVASTETGSSLNPQGLELHVEAIELATNFILNSQLQSPKVLGQSETPAQLTSSGAAWKASDASGTVKIVPAQPDVKGIDIAAAVVAADAKECKGKFISGRNSELVDSEVVFRGFSSCEDTAGARLGQYFIVPRKKGGFAVFSVLLVLNPGNTPSPAPNEERLATFRKAALTAVAQ